MHEYRDSSIRDGGDQSNPKFEFCTKLVRPYYLRLKLQNGDEGVLRIGGPIQCGQSYEFEFQEHPT